MKNLKSLLGIITICLAASIPSIASAKTCKVADPIGTPLKYRSAPYGKVLGALSNGTYIYISEFRTDKNGQLWVRAFSEYDDRYLGWVYYKYLSC